MLAAAEPRAGQPCPISGLNQIMLQYSGRHWDFNASVLAQTRVWQILIDSLTGKRAEEKAN